MHTPAHAILNVCLLERARSTARPPARGWAVFGALLPDLPMFAFYVWARWIAGMPQATIWGEAYFRSDWQLFFDLFNSIPLALAGLLAALGFRHPGAGILFSSVILHCVADLLVHNDDAHRHFLPISQFRFESPVSYWDPRHHGALGSGIEAWAVVIASIVLWPRVRVAGRICLAIVVGLYAAGQAWLHLG